MDVTEALKLRRTIRGYKPDPVPEETIREVIDLARLAPSNSNTQPWHLAVVSGDARHRLEEAIFDHMNAGNGPNPAFPPGGAGLWGVYKERQYACAFRYYDSLGIEREDKKGRGLTALRNWTFFGAPHAAFLSMPKTMNRANAIDLGIFLQSIMLLFTERGISCCAQGALAAFPDPVRAIAQIPEDNAIMCGLSFGYEDPDAPANTARMDREPLETVASFTS